MAEVKTTAAETAATVKTTAAVKPKAEAKTYVCKVKCYWKNKLWQPGDKITYGGDIPQHFELVK